jgi:exopolysaccharide production negative regulator
MNRPAIFASAALKLDLAKLSGYFLLIALFGPVCGSTETYALDGTRSPANAAPAIGQVAPEEAMYSANLRAWFRARQIGDVKAARKVLEDAARDGDVGAAWKLGRMYADGDGVEQSDQRAFEYFRALADSHAEETPGTTPAVFVAKAFVEIGSYYLTGIPNYIKPDAARAHQMFSYAGSYFGDPDAQYRLGRTYLDGQGTAKSPKQAARWLSNAAGKGQYQAQAAFGAMLFKGEYVPRDAARGLMYLMLGTDAASSEETWITDLYAAALKQATEDERTRALDVLKRWIDRPRSGR